MAKATSRKKGDRREKIIQAALSAYIENGVSGTRMNDVAKRAGVDPPLVHYYFEDLEALHLAAILKILESLKEYSLREAEKHSNDPKRWMAEYIQAPLLWVQENPEYMHLWVYFYAMSTNPGRFRDLNSQIRKTGRERIAYMVFRGIEKGVFRLSEGETVDDAASEIQGIMTGLSVVVATEDGVAMKQMEKLLKRRVFSLLGC